MQTALNFDCSPPADKSAPAAVVVTPAGSMAGGCADMTSDEQIGMAWWNHVSPSVRAHWLSVAGSPVPADAWAAFKLRSSL